MSYLAPNFSSEFTRHFREALVQLFNNEELALLCEDIQIDFDNIGGATKSTRALELVKYTSRRNNMDKLLEAAIIARPQFNWLEALGAEVKPYLKNIQRPDSFKADSQTTSRGQLPDDEQIQNSETQALTSENLVELIQSNNNILATSDSTPIRKILFMAANPSDTTRLRLGKEFDEIKAELERGIYRDKVILVLPQLATTARDLTRALLRESPMIMHFSGHGNINGAIYFENEKGNAALVSGEALGSLFALFSGQVQCVILNACFSATQAQAISKYIPYVIGMNHAIPDTVAIAFSIGFYQALANGRSIEQAYEFGRVQIDLINDNESR